MEAEKHAFESCFRELKASKPSDTDDALRSLKRRCPAISDDMISEALRTQSEAEWIAESYEQSDYKVEEKRHITSRGLKVRSKSEVLIAEKLYEYNIDFRYEQILRIDNSTLLPDFTIRRSDGKIFIWEHQGLTNVQSYLERQISKSRQYASAGFVPWDNLIITYDNIQGDIDLRAVESEIVNKLLL